jgi:TolB-like protein
LHKNYKADSRPEGEAISFELERILDNRKFSEAPRISEFLNYVVSEDLAGRGARINGNSIAIDVYHRDHTFAPRTDPVVRVEARRLRRMLSHYFLTEGKQDALTIDIPKGGYRPQYNVNSETGEGHSTAPGFDSGKPLPISPVIAVLPFRSGETDLQTDELATGITNSLVTALSQFDVIQVISPQSLHGYQGKTQDVRRIGHELGARFIITGSLQQMDRHVRVTVAISHAEDGTQLWARQFDCDLDSTDVFKFEDEIAETVISEGASAYGVISQVLAERIRDLPVDHLSIEEATQLFLSYFKQRSGQEALQLARQAMESVIEREPGIRI